jgi:ATP phosphoribosyltransferase
MECMLIRAQEMARYVEDGILDAGLTGRDWVEGSEADVQPSPISSTPSRASAKCAGFSPCPKPVPFQFREGSGRQDHRHGAGRHDEALSRRNGVTAKVEFSWGATEVKPPVLADAIVEVTETGSSLRANKLRIVETVLESNTQLIANKTSWADPWKRKKLEDLKLLLDGAIAALGKVG